MGKDKSSNADPYRERERAFMTLMKSKMWHMPKKHKTRAILSIFMLCLTIHEALSQGEMATLIPRNVETFFPVAQSKMATQKSSPPVSVSYNEPLPAPSQKTGSTDSTSMKVIVTAVAVTAAVTFILSGLIFFCYQKLVLFKGKEEKKKDNRSLLGVRISNSHDKFQLNKSRFSGGGVSSAVLENPPYSEANMLRKSHSLSFVSYFRDGREFSEVHPLPPPFSRPDSPSESPKKQTPALTTAPALPSPMLSESDASHNHNSPIPITQLAESPAPPPPPQLQKTQHTSNLNPRPPPPPPPPPQFPRCPPGPLSKKILNTPPSPPPPPSRTGKSQPSAPLGANPSRPLPPPPPACSRSALPPLAPKCIGTSSRTRSSAPVKSGDKSNYTENEEGNMRLKLKPLHWDKVLANPDHSMVWDKLTEGSFRLDEQMIESLFGYNPEKIQESEVKKSSMDSSQPRGNFQLLDPRKSQNIAILLRALNVTREEVCDALLEGDGLSTELLEKLIKITLTQEEERKLKDYKDDILKLGPAEQFLKTLLDIPFVFERLDVMLFRATFEEEVSFIKMSFMTLEEACTELRGSRLFLKLLEAVLKTGNRMNAGTYRGDAQAFNLNTLLKLADVKGTDGKTTLLHFVVQEIIRSEGMKLLGKEDDASHGKQEEEDNDDDYIRLGLQAVGGLSNELHNVKKAAVIDSDALVTSVSKLVNGLDKIRNYLKTDTISKEMSFQKSMESFVLQAANKIGEIQAEERRAFLIVKKITLYFHAEASEEKAKLFRIFSIVRDFLGMLDHVCSEIGKTHKSKKNTPRPVEKESPAAPRVLMHNHSHILLQSPFLNSIATKYDSSSDDEIVMSP